ncbi:MAG: 50S ribosomal protein L23 [Thermodesulfobacteriota bacterium]
MDYTKILLKPVVTEKSTHLKDLENKVVFRVAESANKVQIKEAVQKAFNVEVQAVKVLNKKPRIKRKFGRQSGRKPGHKKAYIDLAPGNKIDYFEGV